MKFRILRYSAMTRREIYKSIAKWVLFSLVLLVSYTIEVTMPFASWQPYLTLTTAVAVSFFSEELSGVVFAAFAGMMHPWKTREEYWGYLATFLHTTQTAPVRHSYLDLDALLKGKDFFILTTNQDTQFVKLYPEEKVAEIQGDHRFFQCAACCTDDTWDAVKPVADMVAAMGDDTKIPTDLIPRCPHCGGEAFPWVRGYGNFLQGKKYEEQYEKISRYVLEHKGSKILFLELGVGRMTPMFIQEPFWNMTLSFPHARYIAINNKYDFLPKQLEDKGMTIVADIAQVLRDARDTMDSGDNDR